MNSQVRLSGWGRFPQVNCRLLSVRNLDDAVKAVRGGSPLIPRGAGRAYGDAAINPHATLSMLQMDRLLAFDDAAGLLTCESGVLLYDILNVFVPRGWFPPVTPGTKMVTVGGMIAADVHGKNHHYAGSFCDYVESVDLLLANGEVTICGPNINPELFAATRGGMGLTGIILRATFRLVRIETAYIRQQTLRANSLEQVMEMFEQSGDWPYSVAWIDCLARGSRLGRSLLFRGAHANTEQLPPHIRPAPLTLPFKRIFKVPFDAPSSMLNHFTIGLFNEFYWRRATPGVQLVDYETFFYPLDGILEWNRIYGRLGFTQYQCVLPISASAAGLRRLLESIAAAGLGSFLAVLKLLGRQNGMMSFPMEGYTLALDFPATPITLGLLAELDAIVADHGGRLYLAKDARMSAAMLRRGYAGLPLFQALRGDHRAGEIFRSVQSERLDL